MASLSGLTEEQAQEFHTQFKIGFQTWLAIDRGARAGVRLAPLVLI